MENKDIGKAFREKLDTLEKVPSDAVWVAIDADLAKKKKRRVMYLWLWCTPVAALLLLLGADAFIDETILPGFEIVKNLHSKSSNNYGLNNDESIIVKANDKSEETSIATGAIVNSENVSDSNAAEKSIPIQNNKTQAGSAEFEKSKLNIKTIKSSKHPKRHLNRINKKNKIGNSKIASRNKRKGPKNHSTIEINNLNKVLNQGVTETTSETDTNQKPENATEDVKTDSLSATIAIKEKTRPKKEKDSSVATIVPPDKGSSFGIFLFVAPRNFGLLSKKSSLDTSLDSYATNSEMTFNYGGYIVMKYHEKWTFRFGASMTKLNLTTENVPLNNTNGSSNSNFNNIDYKSTVTNQIIAQQFSDSQYYNIRQEYSYLEFPLEVKYKFFERFIRIEAIGGLSTLILKDNSVIAEADDAETIHMGSTKRVFNAHFSPSIGIGFSTQLMRNLRVNVEPLFKYHLYTNEAGQKPYSLVVQGGLEYTFKRK